LHAPASPAQLGGYDTLSLILGVDVANGMANVAHYSRGFQLVDVHDPAQPKMRGGYTMGGAPSRIQVVGNLSYVTGGNTRFHIMDVSSSDNPVRLGGFDPNGSTRAIRVIGNLAYISGINRLVIEDASDPAHPLQLAAYDYYTADESGIDVAGDRAYFATGQPSLAPRRQQPR